MPALRSPRNSDLRCWSKRGGRVCIIHRGHLGMHSDGEVRWVDQEFTNGAEDIDTKGRL